MKEQEMGRGAVMKPLIKKSIRSEDMYRVTDPTELGTWFKFVRVGDEFMVQRLLDNHWQDYKLTGYMHAIELVWAKCSPVPPTPKEKE